MMKENMVQTYFSWTLLRYVRLMAYRPSVCLSVCCLWRSCTLLTGLNFSATFLHHVIAAMH